MVRWSFVLIALFALISLVGSFRNGSFSSVADAQVTPPLEGAESELPAATAGGASAEPAIVKVGFLVNDIQDINLEHHRYQIDFYIWYQWTDPEINPKESMEFMNDGERWATMRSAPFEEPVQLEDGSFYFRERFLSMFKNNLPLERYPYDQPELRIIIEDMSRGTDELVFVLDEPAVQTASDLSVPGYLIGQPVATVTDWEYRPMGAIDAGNTSSSRIVLTIPLSRPWLPYTMKIFVPLLVVVLCASIVFLIQPKHVDARFGLGISSLLTLVALKWITDGELPLVDYIGLVDSLYLLAFLYIAVGLFETSYTTWQRGRGVDDAVLARIGIFSFIIAGALFLIGCVIISLIFIV